MVSWPYIPTRLLALFLPIALLWIFTACVWSCFAQREGAAELRSAFSEETWADQEDCQECPIVNALSCRLPGRSSLLPQPSHAVQVASPPHAVLDSAQPYSKAALPKPLLAIDPLLERLGALRI